MIKTRIVGKKERGTKRKSFGRCFDDWLLFLHAFFDLGAQYLYKTYVYETVNSTLLTFSPVPHKVPKVHVPQTLMQVKLAHPQSLLLVENRSGYMLRQESAKYVLLKRTVTISVHL